MLQGCCPPQACSTEKKTIALDGKSVDLLVAMRVEAMAFEDYRKVLDPTVFGPAWAVDPAGGVHLNHLVMSMVSSVVLCWESDVKECVTLLSSSIPSPALLDSPTLLRDEVVLKTLSASVKKMHDSNAISLAKSLLELIRGYETRLGSLNLPAVAELGRWRKIARKAFLVEWAVVQIRTFAPTSASDLLKHADMIDSKLRSKGMGGETKDAIPVPAFLSSCLQGMLAKGREIAAAESVPKSDGA